MALLGAAPASTCACRGESSSESLRPEEDVCSVSALEPDSVPPLHDLRAELDCALDEPADSVLELREAASPGSANITAVPRSVPRAVPRAVLRAVPRAVARADHWSAVVRTPER